MDDHRLTELADRSYRTGIFTFTDFLSMAELAAYYEQEQDLLGQISDIEDQLIIKAEWPALVASVSVKAGDDVSAGEALCSLTASSGYEMSLAIDELDVKDVSIDSLRSQLGIMTQDNFLFTGTIRENLRYGKLDATDEEIEEACKKVNAHDFIMNLEKGYDTELTERGGGLSAGQKQLLAFARTILSDPKILILDEATSSIDTKSEILVQKGIATILKGRTSFVIAHRLSTIRNADRIFVIQNGGIAESGNHEELMEKKGLYYNLNMAQA